MNATAERIYVTCDEYCANRIHDPTVDHDKNCGAPLAYRNKLAKELQAKKIKAAAGNDAEPEPPKTTRKRRGEVDGQLAVIQQNPPARDDEKIDYSSYWKDPEIVSAEVIELQRRIDEGEITVGGVPASKACTGKQTRDIDGGTVEIDCIHRVAFRTARTNTCNLEHKHTETLEALCLIHTITHLGGDRPVAGAGPLFGEGG